MGEKGNRSRGNEQKPEWRIKAFLLLFESGRSWARGGLGYEESWLVRTCTSMGKNCQSLVLSKSERQTLGMKAWLS